MVAGAGYANAAAGRAAAGCVPHNVNVVAESTARAGIGGDHGLVVEVISTAFKGKERDLRIALAAVGGAGYRHGGAVDAAEVLAEKHHDVAIKHIATGVEGQRGIGAKPRAARTFSL